MTITNLNGNEVDTALSGQGLSDKGLGAAGRAVHKQALGRLDGQPGEGLRVLQWPLNSLAELVFEFCLTSYVCPRHLHNNTADTNTRSTCMSIQLVFLNTASSKPLELQW